MGGLVSTGTTICHKPCTPSGVFRFVFLSPSPAAPYYYCAQQVHTYIHVRWWGGQLVRVTAMISRAANKRCGPETHQTTPLPSMPSRPLEHTSESTSDIVSDVASSDEDSSDVGMLVGSNVDSMSVSVSDSAERESERSEE